jgi:thiamine transport system permease protein
MHKMLLAVPLILFLLICLVYPTLTLLAKGIDFHSLPQSFILERLLSTLLQASLSSALVLFLALGFGTLLARFSFRGKTWLEAILTIPFVVPVLVASLGFLSLFGQRGWIYPLEGTIWLVLLANTFYNLGLAIRFVISALSSQSLELEFVAQLEGASDWQVWYYITLPLALPSALIGAGFTFLYSFASFGVPLLLGGWSLATLEVEMYQSIQRLELGNASALALVQFVITLSAAYLVTSFEKRNSHNQEFDSFRPKAKGLAKGLLFVAIGLLLILTFAPLLTVFIKSISNANGLTLEHYQALFVVSESVFQTDIGTAIWNNLRFAVLTLLLAVPLGISYALAIWQTKNNYLDVISLLPLAISSSVLGVAFIITYPNFTAQLGSLILIYTLSAYPLITRATLSALRQLPTHLLEAAQLDGANTWQQFYLIVLPLISRAILNGLALGFAVVIGEFAATLMLSRPEWATLSTLIYQRLARPNQLGQASALAVLLLLLSLSGFMLLSFRSRQPRP